MSKNVTISFAIDWKLLRSHKRALIALPEHEAIKGMLNLIDHIQDKAVESGQATEQDVFGRKTART